MAMVVRTNTMAANANRQLGMNNSAVSRSIEKLASGFRINRAGDDASGLAISEKMKAQITALEQAASNSQDGISLIQTAEGALTEVHSMLNRMVELAEKAANGTMDDAIDRLSIQKEVDALTSEIDRISKNTNFNGINLLDGSLGLNKEAFNAISNISSKGAEIMDILDSQFGTVAAGTAHETTLGKAQAGPAFSIDFADYAISGADAGQNQVLAINVGGEDFSVTLTGQTSYSATDIAAAFVTEFNDTETAAGANTAHQIGTSGMYVSASAAGGKVSFAYAGMAANTTTAATTDKFTKTEADTMNAVLSSPVTLALTAGAAGAAESGSIDHANFVVQAAQEEVIKKRAGIDLSITADMIQDGNKLTIDGKTFVFKTGADSNVTAGASETLIDLSDPALATDADKIASAIQKMSNSEGTSFRIEAKDDTTIHIDQLVSDTKKFTVDDMKKLISGATAPAANAGTKVSIDPSKIKSGNSLNIGGKTYTFAESATTPVQDGAVRVVMGANGADALTNLKAELAKPENGGYKADVGTNDITIYSTDASAKKGPAVIGGGLTLQIGDTSDIFNQMTVAVKDMSTEGLNISGLSVSSAADAAKALDLVKKGPNSAINQVSLVRADLGAFQNRLEHTINNLDVAAENMTSANSRIRDTDMAKEMMNYTKMNVLTQAAQAMLAQANQQPQAILQLLQ